MKTMKLLLSTLVCLLIAGCSKQPEPQYKYGIIYALYGTVGDVKPDEKGLYPGDTLWICKTITEDGELQNRQLNAWKVRKSAFRYSSPDPSAHYIAMEEMPKDRLKNLLIAAKNTPDTHNVWKNVDIEKFMNEEMK